MEAEGTMTGTLEGVKKGRIRWVVVTMLFVLTAINYADRATLSIAGTSIAKDLKLDPVAMGYIFSAFGWSYVIGQIPGGWLLDRFGSKSVYFFSIVFWSLFTVSQGLVGSLVATTAVVMLFSMRFLVGLAESPSFPANARIVAAWFPANERGTASAIFNSAQYFATVIFAPLMGWVTHQFGWPYVFVVMGCIGVLAGLLFLKTVYGPKEHPNLKESELEYIEKGGALVDLDRGKKDDGASKSVNWAAIKQLLSNRMLLGIYLGQYCITTLTYFFITWFPVYLIKERHMSILKAGFVASLPALCGFFGGILGGVISDYLLKKGYSLSVARKTPIVLGMLLSCTMVICNFVDAQWVVVFLMALAFFGKGIGALGWAVVSDTSPKEISGLSGGLFNTFGNTAGITTPIVIGYIVKNTGGFQGALVFVAANALLAIVSYLVIVGEIKRVKIKL